MNIVEQLMLIDELIEQMRQKETSKIQQVIDSGGPSMGFSLNMHGLWDRTSPWSLKQVSDFDGIPDALDNTLGPGA